MPYNPTIPQANDIPAQSQTLILENFTELNIAEARDHIALGLANSGHHNRVSLTNAGVAPTTPWGLFATAAGMFLHTAAADHNITAVTAAGGQYNTVLPSGLIVKFGLGGTANITFTNAFTAHIHGIYLSNTGDATTTGVSITWPYPAGHTGFNVTFVGGVHNFYWLAIGV
jgi:hypothetical protein